MQVPRDGLVVKLGRLTASQQSIESVSAFCIFYHKDARGVAQTWDGEFYKAPAERRLALLYLANHILQEGRKHGSGFQDEFFKVLPKAMQHMLKTTQDDKTRRSVQRLVSVWEERRVFGSQHIKSFRSLLNGAGGSSGSDTGSKSQPKSHAAAKAATVADAVTAAHKAAEAAADATKKYHIGWKQDVMSSGSIEALSAALELVRARVGALQAETAARRHATEVLKAELAKQEAGLAAAEEQLPMLSAQQGQGEQRLGLLANQAAAAAAAAAAQAQHNGDGPGASGADAGGSPEAPAMETDDDDALAGLADATPQTIDSLAAPTANPLAAFPAFQQQQQQPQQQQHSAMGADLQQLLQSGSLAQAIQSMGTAGGMGGQLAFQTAAMGGQVPFQAAPVQQAPAAGDDDAPYDPEYPD